MARNANVTFTLPPTATRLNVCRQKGAEHGGKCGMLTSPLVRLVYAGLSPSTGEERRRWKQPRSDPVMTANDAEGMDQKRRHRSMAIPPLRRQLPFWPAEMLLGDDKGSQRGVAVAGYAQCLPKLHFGLCAVFCPVPPGSFSEPSNRPASVAMRSPFQHRWIALHYVCIDRCRYDA